jgi:hypothetical protein
VLGEQPVTWPGFHHKYNRNKDLTVLDHKWDLCTTVGVDRESLIDWATPFFWDPDWCETQVYLDAWTKDGTQLIRKGGRVIKARGRDIKPLENKISNASVGQMPKFSVYTTACALWGVTPFFTFNSCTGGRQGGFADFLTWVDYLTERATVHIRSVMYYNHPEARSKLPKTFATDPFDTGHFRVCSPSYPTQRLCN